MNKTIVIYGGLAVVAGVAGYLLYKKAGTTLATTLNPASDQNAAYKAVNSLGQSSGLFSNDDTLGTWLYALANPSQAATGLPSSVDTSGASGYAPSDASSAAAASNGGWGKLGGYISSLFGTTAPQQTSGAPLLAAADSGPSLTQLTSGSPLDYLLNPTAVGGSTTNPRPNYYLK